MNTNTYIHTYLPAHMYTFIYTYTYSFFVCFLLSLSLSFFGIRIWVVVAEASDGKLELVPRRACQTVLRSRALVDAYKSGSEASVGVDSMWHSGLSDTLAR